MPVTDLKSSKQPHRGYPQTKMGDYINDRLNWLSSSGSISPIMGWLFITVNNRLPCLQAKSYFTDQARIDWPDSDRSVFSGDESGKMAKCHFFVHVFQRTKITFSKLCQQLLIAMGTNLNTVNS